MPPHRRPRAWRIAGPGAAYQAPGTGQFSELQLYAAEEQ